MDTTTMRVLVVEPGKRTAVKTKGESGQAAFAPKGHSDSAPNELPRRESRSEPRPLCGTSIGS